MEARFFKHILKFNRPSGTSRGVLFTKDTYILEIQNEGKKGVGECGLFRGLSADDTPEYENKLQWLCENINMDREVLQQELEHFPSIWIGYEQAILNIEHGENLYFPSAFTEKKDSITTNGLIWMGDAHSMKSQIEEKLQLGFRCVKLKIGVDWNSEHRILESLRAQYPADVLEIRVDANGGFTFEKAQQVLDQLSKMQIHSIEQPIKSGNFREMEKLCRNTPTPIALDEELIGIFSLEEKNSLLKQILPQYIILKPTLVGGFSGTDEWIHLAEQNNIGWWITSALESNIGLNAIAQFTYGKKNKMPQGLGTGGLFVNNFDPSLTLKGEQLWFIK